LLRRSMKVDIPSSEGRIYSPGVLYKHPAFVIMATRLSG